MTNPNIPSHPDHNPRLDSEPRSRVMTAVASLTVAASLFLPNAPEWVVSPLAGGIKQVASTGSQFYDRLVVDTHSSLHGREFTDPILQQPARNLGSAPVLESTPN